MSLWVIVPNISTNIIEVYDWLEICVYTWFGAQGYIWIYVNIFHRLILWKTKMVYFSSFRNFDLICRVHIGGLFSKDCHDSENTPIKMHNMPNEKENN